MEKRVVFRSGWLPWALLAPQALIIGRLGFNAAALVLAGLAFVSALALIASALAKKAR